MNSSALVIAGVLGLGGPELVLILAVVMLLFGGKRLPDLAKGLGKSIKEFKRASQETEESAPPVLPSAVVQSPGVAAQPQPAAAPGVSAPGPLQP
jgi:sec-independent protein translocase protein TatA